MPSDSSFTTNIAEFCRFYEAVLTDGYDVSSAMTVLLPCSQRQESSVISFNYLFFRKSYALPYGILLGLTVKCFVKFSAVPRSITPSMSVNLVEATFKNVFALQIVFHLSLQTFTHPVHLLCTQSFPLPPKYS